MVQTGNLFLRLPTRKWPCQSDNCDISKLTSPPPQFVRASLDCGFYSSEPNPNT